jgi:hypothetical protein
VPGCAQRQLARTSSGQVVTLSSHLESPTVTFCTKKITDSLDALADKAATVSITGQASEGERVELSAAMLALAVVTAVATAVMLREVIRDLGDRS